MWIKRRWVFLQHVSTRIRRDRAIATQDDVQAAYSDAAFDFLLGGHKQGTHGLTWRSIIYGFSANCIASMYFVHDGIMLDKYDDCIAYIHSLYICALLQFSNVDVRQLVIYQQVNATLLSRESLLSIYHHGQALTKARLHWSTVYGVSTKNLYFVFLWNCRSLKIWLLDSEAVTLHRDKAAATAVSSCCGLPCSIQQQASYRMQFIHSKRSWLGTVSVHRRPSDPGGWQW